MWQELPALLPDAIGQTLEMVAVSATLASLAGIPLGVVLYATDRGRFLQSVALNRVLGAVVNAMRSTPFIILMVAIIPLTRALVGTSIGTKAAIVPLTLAATPFIARIVEGALREVDDGLIEAARAMGATPFQVVLKVLLPEARPGIVGGITLATISLIGYSAMAGAVGGGGLGDLGIRYGYERFQLDVMFATVAVLIALVQLVQFAGDRLVQNLRHK
jgi:D-methionine transport system permease protein